MQILATVCLLMLVSTVSTAIVLSGHGHDNNTDFKADPCVLAVPLESGFHSHRCATVLLVLVPGTERYITLAIGPLRCAATLMSRSSLSFSPW